MFHLNNREASREINITVASSRVKFEPNPTYLGVVLDRSLTFGPQLKQLAAKCNSRVALIRKLAGTHWGASAHTREEVRHQAELCHENCHWLRKINANRVPPSAKRHNASPAAT